MTLPPRTPFASYKHFDQTRCINLVQKHGCLIEYLSDKQKTYEVYFAAARTYKPVIKFLQPDDQEKINIVRVRKNPYFIQTLTREQQTSEIIITAIRKNPDVFRYVCPELQTPEIVSLAVNGNYNNFHFVQPDLQTPEMIDIVLFKNPYLLKYVNKSKLTFEVCARTIKQSSFVIQYLSDPEQTFELCKIALFDPNFRNFDRFVYRINPAKLTPALFRMVINQSYFYDHQVRNILENFPKTVPICTIAIHFFLKLVRYIKIENFNSGFIC